MASNLSRTKFCRTLICARETLSSSCALAGPFAQCFFPWPRFRRGISLFFCSLELATASRMYRCLSRIFDTPIGFAQRISHPSFSMMLFGSENEGACIEQEKIERAHSSKLRRKVKFFSAAGRPLFKSLINTRGYAQSYQTLILINV